MNPKPTDAEVNEALDHIFPKLHQNMNEDQRDEITFVVTKHLQQYHSVDFTCLFMKETPRHIFEDFIWATKRYLSGEIDEEYDENQVTLPGLEQAVAGSSNGILAVDSAADRYSSKDRYSPPLNDTVKSPKAPKRTLKTDPDAPSLDDASKSLHASKAPERTLKTEPDAPPLNDASKSPLVLKAPERKLRTGQEQTIAGSPNGILAVDSAAVRKSYKDRNAPSLNDTVESPKASKSPRHSFKTGQEVTDVDPLNDILAMAKLSVNSSSKDRDAPPLNNKIKSLKVSKASERKFKTGEEQTVAGSHNGILAVDSAAVRKSSKDRDAPALNDTVKSPKVSKEPKRTRKTGLEQAVAGSSNAVLAVDSAAVRETSKDRDAAPLNDTMKSLKVSKASERKFKTDRDVPALNDTVKPPKVSKASKRTLKTDPDAPSLNDASKSLQVSKALKRSYVTATDNEIRDRFKRRLCNITDDSERYAMLATKFVNMAREEGVEPHDYMSILSYLKDMKEL
ncbi:hypothetical protein Ddc_03876 [Ditylenchus destructor]|nr:hypothetical protein Ddc_03876 [Ditylenchus destructor]